MTVAWTRGMSVGMERDGGRRLILELGWTGLDALNTAGERRKGVKDNSATLIQTWVDDQPHP